jgi:hypothetical protein
MEKIVTASVGCQSEKMVSWVAAEFAREGKVSGRVIAE